MEPVGTYLSAATALQIAAVIYAVFGLQMFLVPAFFLAENVRLQADTMTLRPLRASAPCAHAHIPSICLPHR